MWLMAVQAKDVHHKEHRITRMFNFNEACCSNLIALRGRELVSDASLVIQFSAIKIKDAKVVLTYPQQPYLNRLKY